MARAFAALDAGTKPAISLDELINLAKGLQ